MIGWWSHWYIVLFHVYMGWSIGGDNNVKRNVLTSKTVCCVDGGRGHAWAVRSRRCVQSKDTLKWRHVLWAAAKTPSQNTAGHAPRDSVLLQFHVGFITMSFCLFLGFSVCPRHSVGVRTFHQPSFFFNLYLLNHKQLMAIWVTLIMSLSANAIWTYSTS